MQFSKQHLRRQFLQQRQSLSGQDWQKKSESIVQHLHQTEWFQQAQTIFAYHSFRQEPTLQSLFDEDHLWGLPRCVGSELIWHHCQPTDFGQFQQGKYGIKEPKATLPLLAPTAADLILVPALACDAQGFRLGYGGGYYDRLLSQMSRAKTIGIVFRELDFQLLPLEPWDQPLKAVCTDAGFRRPDGKI